MDSGPSYIAILAWLLILLMFLGFLAGIILWSSGGSALWSGHKKRGAGTMACGRCGYDVRGLTVLACPECGSDLREVGIVRAVTSKRRDAGRWLTICCGLALLAITIILLNA